MNKARQQLREDSLQLFLYGLQAVQAYPLTRCAIERTKEGITISYGKERLEYRLNKSQRVTIIGAGKASANMAKAIEDQLGDCVRGIVSVKDGHGLPLNYISIREASHPIPDARGVENARQALGYLEGLTENDVVILLLSGGGSALLPLPAEGITLEDKQSLTRLLITCDADINEINCVPKHISDVKGGQLARRAYPAHVVSLIISDVVDDRLDSIASGPTVPDPTTFAQAWQIIQKYHLEKQLSLSIKERLQKGICGEIPETPKKGDSVFDQVHNIILASNQAALNAIRSRAIEMGYNANILTSSLTGNIESAVRWLKNEAEKNEKLPVCLIAGGEITVNVQGKGLGGRNQEFCLRMAKHLGKWQQAVMLAAGTDGTDGPTNAAGAIADNTTLIRAKDQNLRIEQFLEANDSYNFFNRLNDLVITGPTATNVMDIYLMLISS